MDAGHDMGFRNKHGELILLFASLITKSRSRISLDMQHYIISHIHIAEQKLQSFLTIRYEMKE